MFAAIDVHQRDIRFIKLGNVYLCPATTKSRVRYNSQSRFQYLGALEIFTRGWDRTGGAERVFSLFFAFENFFFHFFCLFSCSSSFENNSIHDNCDKRSKQIESITFTSTIRQAPRDVVIPLAYCTMPTSSETRARFFGAIRSGMYFPLRRREREREFESIGSLFQ